MLANCKRGLDSQNKVRGSSYLLMLERVPDVTDLPLITLAESHAKEQPETAFHESRTASKHSCLQDTFPPGSLRVVS